jgi:hypothetical protein
MNNLGTPAATGSFYFVLDGGIIKPKEVNAKCIRMSVAEALGLPRIISLELGYEKDPAAVQAAIRGSILRELTVWSVKDRKAYLAPPDFLARFGVGDADIKAKSVLVEVLKKEVHPAFNTLGELRLKPTWLPHLDGVVMVIRGRSTKTSQIAVAVISEAGLVTAKGTCKPWEHQLDCPEIPEGYDGWLNLVNFALNGVKVEEGWCPPEWHDQARLANGRDFWVSLQTELNIYKGHISPAIAQFWPSNAKAEYLKRWIEQIEEVIKAKAKSSTPSEVAASIGRLVKPFGAVADLLDVASRVGAFPKSAESMVENLFSAALLRLIADGPVSLMGFAYIFPGRGLRPGEVILPKQMLVRADLLRKLEKKQGVWVEIWRNPVLPGLDHEGKSPSAGRFRVVGVTEGNDIYLNPLDVLQMGGDFDGDRVSVHLSKPFGLKEISHVPVPVRKVKTGDSSREALSRLGGLASHLGEAFNLAANVEDNLKGGGSIGALGWIAVQACVAAQKHTVEVEIDGQKFTSGQPNPGQVSLTWEKLRAMLQYRAAQLGSSVEPSSAMQVWRFLRGVSKALATATVVLSRIPRNLEGFMAEPLRLGSLSAKIKSSQIPVCEDEHFFDYILGALRARKAECQPSEIVPINADKVRELLARLDRAQAEGAEELSEVDNDWGFRSFYREWSKLMSVCDDYNRIHYMIRLLVTARQRQKSIWYFLRLLGADYMLVRAVGREADKPLNEVYRPNSFDLSSRDAREVEEEDEELEELKARLGI